MRWRLFGTSRLEVSSASTGDDQTAVRHRVRAVIFGKDVTLLDDQALDMAVGTADLEGTLIPSTAAPPLQARLSQMLHHRHDVFDVHEVVVVVVVTGQGFGVCGAPGAGDEDDVADVHARGVVEIVTGR